MAGMRFKQYQLDAIMKMHNGCILCGGVGSGKSFTALGYYYLLSGGDIFGDEYKTMQDDPPMDLYIITTARKRDTFEWDKELLPFLLSTDPKCNHYKNKVVIDSWNNIKKYVNAKDAFFIFDEQRVVGNGTWVKSFLKIVKRNLWILLSATPGDTWSDYIPVFIANGYYRNRSDFSEQHIVYARYCTFPKVERYVNTRKLVRLRERVLVDMDFERKTQSEHNWINCEYDISTYKQVMKTRWDPYKDEPIQNAAGLCYILRRIVNSDSSRLRQIESILEEHPKSIIFYNFDYERDDLIGFAKSKRIKFAEWSGHAHQELPQGNKWLYLVQYTAGCEGWNCIKTDTTIFYSQNYSYKVLEQASGRIARLNTPYERLFYYHLTSRAPIDRAIRDAISRKKKFNERKFVEW